MAANKSLSEALRRGGVATSCVRTHPPVVGAKIDGLIQTDPLDASHHATPWGTDFRTARSRNMSTCLGPVIGRVAAFAFPPPSAYRVTCGERGYRAIT